MLVLSRQIEQTIMIGDEIEVKVVSIRGDKVKLGVKAPAHVAVHRREVYERIQLEKKQKASQVQATGPHAA